MKCQIVFSGKIRKHFKILPPEILTKHAKLNFTKTCLFNIMKISPPKTKSLQILKLPFFDGKIFSIFE